MKDPRDVIQQPVVSEKSYDLIEDNNTYTFLVDPRSNKTEIRQAVEAIFDVKVTRVNTQNRKGKVKRTGWKLGKRPDRKRALVTLAEGHEIDIFGYRRMGIKKYKPTSPGRRFRTVSDFSEITKTTPEKSLIVKKSSTGGRNAYGRITSRHRGGGHKQRYRIVDFRRDKDGVPASVAAIEYDPNRNARIALLHYHDGEKRYILAPLKIEVGDVLESGSGAEIRPGNSLPLRNIPAGTTVHAVELRPGGGAKLGRSAGAQIQLVAKEGDLALLRMPSGEMRNVELNCKATVGQVGNPEAELVKGGKAGRSRWKGVRPQTRGVAMNPVDHPLGGGEGRSSGGRHPVSPWGKPEGRTRKKHKESDRMIVRRRNKKGRR